VQWPRSYGLASLTSACDYLFICLFYLFFMHKVARNKYKQKHTKPDTTSQSTKEKALKQKAKNVKSLI